MSHVWDEERLVEYEKGMIAHLGVPSLVNEIRRLRKWLRHIDSSGCFPGDCQRALRGEEPPPTPDHPTGCRCNSCEIRRLETEVRQLRERVSEAVTCECPEFCKYHARSRFEEMRLQIIKLGGTS